ncbi:MAG: PrgI family protein [Candidatus Levybacteria bacterium]|nr:PrgI family protein [Candidatus Levybacteria bacterium]
MENHPIPQDVTGFKFRLIGSITLKQFLYLLGAGGIDLALYFLPMPIFIKIPLMGIPAIIALALAFVPIDGRPMDKMILNFLRALPGENEYIYRKVGVDMPFFAFNAPTHAKPAAQSMDSRTSQKALLFSQLSRSYFNADEEEQQGIQNISSLFQADATPTTGFVNRVVNADAPPAPTSAAPIPTSAETKTQESLAKPFMPQKNMEADAIQAAPVIPPIVSQPVAEQQPQAAAPIPVPPVVAVEPVVPQVAETQSAPPVQKAEAPVMQAQTAAPTAAPTPTFATPQASYESPNVIEGIVKDPRGKPLPHVIVEILDVNGIAKRTFRTGQNGMFVSATPMAPGIYTIHSEDTLKKQEFEDKVIEVNGSVLPVIEIISTDQREKLRRELFGQSNVAA